MVFQIFSTPSGAEEETGWRQLKIGDINDAYSFEYTKHFCGVGVFTLEIPLTSLFADKLRENVILYRNKDNEKGDAFIIKNIVEAENSYKITGYDLNGILRDRLTEYSLEENELNQGFDAVTGSTETCVKHYVDFNLANPINPNRAIPRFGIKKDLNRGTAQDRNRVRLQVVEDIVREMCEAAKLGYRVDIAIGANLLSMPMFWFDVYEQVDKTANQKERNRVVFSKGRKNITGITRETGITADLNTFYCETSSSTTTLNKDSDEVEKVGFDRREGYLSLNCESTDEIRVYAEKEYSDRYNVTDSLTIKAGNPKEYGVLYDVGDIVTVYDNKKQLQLDSVISAVTEKITATSHEVEIILGETKPRLLDGMNKNNGATNKTLISNPPVVPSATNLYVYYGVLNENKTISTTRTEAIGISFANTVVANLFMGCSVQTNLTTGGKVDYYVIYDNAVLHHYQQTQGVGYNTFTLSIPLIGLTNGQHRLIIQVASDDAVGTIIKDVTSGYVTGAGLASFAPWDGTITIKEEITPFKATKQTIALAPLTESYGVDKLEDSKSVVSEIIAPFAVAKQTIALAEMVENLPQNPIGTNEEDTIIYLTFANPIIVQDGVEGVEIKGTTAGVNTILTPTTTEIVNQNTIKFTFAESFKAVAVDNIQLLGVNTNIIKASTGTTENFTVNFKPVYTETTEGE